MIQAKDLRTSNLIYRLGNVSEVDWSTIKLCAQRNKQFNEDWKPIPLTPEWLDRFGFEKNQNYASMRLPINHLTSEGNRVYIVICVDGDSWVEIIAKRGTSVHPEYTELQTDVINTQYVHQLQNLYFCLTGKELTLKEQTF